MKNTINGLVVWFVVTLFVIYSFCLNTASAVFATAIKTSLHASDVGASIAVGAFIVGFACMQIPAGYLLDKFNPRLVISAGVGLLALGNILISFSNSLILFSLSNLIQGIGGSFAFIAAGVMISQWFPQKKFPIMFGLTQTLSCVLSGFIHYVFVHQLEVISWNQLYQYLFIFGFVLFVLTIVIVRSPAGYKMAEGGSLKASLSVVLKNKQIWLCALATASSFGILMAYGGFWYTQIQNYYSVGIDDSLMISGMIFAGIGIGTPILGWLSNVVKSRVVVVFMSLVVGNMMLLLGIYLPHFQINTLIPIKTISFFIGFLLSGSMLIYTIVSEISSNETRGVALSVTNTGVFLFNTAMMFLPYLFITTASKTFFTYLWVFPFFIMISILLTYFIKDSYSMMSAKS